MSSVDNLGCMNLAGCEGLEPRIGPTIGTVRSCTDNLRGKQWKVGFQKQMLEFLS